MGKGKISNVLIWILMGLLIVGVAGFGATNFGGSVQTIATVGDTEVDTERYALDLQQELQNAASHLGRVLSIPEAEQAGITNNVLARLVTSATLEDEARVLGLSVGDEFVRNQIVNTPAFQGHNGGFDREAYTFALQNVGLDAAGFESRIRVETSANIISTAVSSGIPRPQTYAETLLTFAAETRDASWVRITASSLPEAVPAPTDAELAAFHSDNPDLFTRPESKRITYAWITPEMIADSIEVDDFNIQALYDERRDIYLQPERRLVERLVFGSAADAEAASARITDGTISFDDLVAERGLNPSDVDLGDVTQAQLGSAGAVVFGLDGPGITDPVDSDLGPAIFRMNAVLVGVTQSLEDVREGLISELAIEQAEREISDNLAEVDDLLAGGFTLEELVAETNLELGEILWNEDTFEGPGVFDEFIEAAILVQNGDFPEAIEISSGGIVALRLEDIVAERVPPLSDIRSEVAGAWEAQATQDALVAEAERLIEGLDDNDTLASLNQAGGHDPELRRDAQPLGRPADYITAVFDLEENEVQALGDGDTVLIVQLDAINPADSSNPDIDSFREVIERQIAQGISADMLGAFTQSLQISKGVDVNSNALNALLTQIQTGGGHGGGHGF